MIEMSGIPTTVVTRDGFDVIVANAFAGFGFPSEAPVTYIFPSDMFLQGSDLTPLAEHMDEMLAGLTDWKPEHEGLGMGDVATVTLDGKDYREVYEKCNKFFLRNRWSDDLPIVPPDDDLVNWILTGTERDPQEMLGTVTPRGGVATPHSLAVCLAMAGGRPEYYPVFEAVVKAAIRPESTMQSWSSTTNSCIPVHIINGPVAKDIRLGHGYNCMGPNAAYPAGQIIGRALRILQMTLGGALPGTGDMAIFGGLSATNCVFAEDEENVPEGWKLWSEERGYARGTNVVTQTLVNSMNNIYWYFGDHDNNEATLTAVGKIMGVPNMTKLDKYNGAFKHDGTDVVNPNTNSGLVVLPPAFIKSLIESNDMTQDKLRERLWEESKLPYELMERMGYLQRAIDYVCLEVPKPGDMIPYTPTPGQIHMAFAGGSQGGHGYWMGGMGRGVAVSEEITLPSNWDELLLDAEIDLGPVPLG